MFTYSDDNTTVTGLSGAGFEKIEQQVKKGSEVKITIPSTHNGVQVISIRKGAFANYTSLTNIIIPNSVTSIEEMTFSGCTSLTNIIIPNSVTSIGISAFHSCTSLTSVAIGENVTSIGDGAFSYCTSLTNITIPNSVTSIGYQAFNNCGFTKIEIPQSVTTITDGWIFYNCKNLTDIYCPGNASEPAGWNAYWQGGAFRNGKGEPVVVHWNESMPK